MIGDFIYREQKIRLKLIFISDLGFSESKGIAEDYQAEIRIAFITFSFLTMLFWGLFRLAYYTLKIFQYILDLAFGCTMMGNNKACMKL